MKYLFILGNNPNLSIAEIKAIYPEMSVIKDNDVFLLSEIKDFDCQKAIHQLGGTIKIAEVISEKIDKEKIIDLIKNHKTESKVKFGFSFYGVKPTNIGMEIKKELRGLGISSRLVVSREKSLSAVIVKKEKVIDFIITEKIIGKTCAVQEFEEYSKRDYKRPRSDARSGMLPPKLARIMVNLAGNNRDKIILDPFCGSATLLMEAMTVGYNKIIGSDLSKKAVEDSKLNMDWLASELKLDNPNYQIYNIDVKNISQKLDSSSIDVISTEPYLGPPISGNEDEKQITGIKKDLEKLYISSFTEFKKILKPKGKIVIVFPSWHINNKIYKLDIEKNIYQLGFKRLDKDRLVYKREKQKVWRNITIWQK